MGEARRVQSRQVEEMVVEVTELLTENGLAGRQASLMGADAVSRNNSTRRRTKSQRMMSAGAEVLCGLAVELGRQPAADRLWV